MSAPLLYNYDLDADCYAIRLIAGCLGIPLTLKNLDIFPGHEHRTPEMLALNPQGRLPVLDDAGVVLTQPVAIALYLAENHAPEHLLLPTDAATGARMLDWMTFAARELGVAVQARACSMLDAPGDLPALQAAARRALRMVDDHLTLQGFKGEGFVAGPAPTLADLLIFPAFALSRDFAIDHDDFPALRLWARRVRQIAGFHTMPGIPDYH